jgi:ribose transport system substrate-binding protein
MSLSSSNTTAPALGRSLPRRTLLGIAFAACALGLTACGQQSGTPLSPTAGGAGGNVQLGCTIPTFNHPFFVAMKRGLEEEARAQGVSINVVDGKDDSQAQLTAIDNFVVQGVSAIILCPTETETLGPGVEKANRSGIPVVTVNRTVDGGEVVTYVGADDTEGGRLQARTLMEALPNGGNIVLLQGVLGSSPQRNREAGLEEVLREDPRYRIVKKVEYRFRREMAVDRMQGILLEFPRGRIDAVVAQSDDGALGAADLCGEQGRSELKLIGFNGESAVFDAIREGRIHGTVLQDAETQGREAVRAALKHLKGETVENPQITPLYAITTVNLSDHQPAWQSDGQ